MINCPFCGSIMYDIGCFECSHSSCTFRCNYKDYDILIDAMKSKERLTELESLVVKEITLHLEYIGDDWDNGDSWRTERNKLKQFVGVCK